jgi:para-nitrobenzyl esterase
MKGVVEVRQGRLRGVRRGDLWSFSGIPYAMAPVGPLRWCPPAEAESWDGIRDASNFGPIAPQSASVAGITSPSDPDNSEPHSEDCLSLNVWTPELPGSSASGRDEGRPVMVFIHGGGFTSGSGSVFLYRGGNLVRNGDAVVVTLNYRLGALGFLGHRKLSDGHCHIGNWGLHDQVAALRWVHDNIAAFGGDARNVTIFGESAGGMSVAALLSAPGAAGLFHRAIIESGGGYAHSVEEAEQAAARLAAVLGVAECERGSLESVPAAELGAATEEIGRRRPDPGMLPLPYLPTIDGVFLTQHPLTAVADGASSDIDLLIGTNRDEMTLFGLGNPALLNMDEEGLARWTANALPHVPSNEVVESYRNARSARSEPVAPRDIWVAAGSDIVFRWPSLQFAAAHTARGGTTFVYLFDWESPAFDGILGSCHALELPFVFGAVHAPVVQLFSGGGPTVDTLSQQMQQAWLLFAKAGNPSHEGIAPWQPWDPVGRATMIFGEWTRLENAPRNEELAVLDRYRPLPGPVSQASQP